MEEELLHSGELEKWASTARGRTYRRFFIRLTNKRIRWHLPTEMDDKIFLGQLEVNRIVNVQIDLKSEHNAAGYSVFVVKDPEESHEFRSRSQKIVEEWVQHIKNATLPKTRRKKLEESSNRDRINSSNSNTSKCSSNLSSSEPPQPPTPLKPAMVTEIIGGTHIERPSDPTESDKAEKTTNTILIMNAEPFSNRPSVDTDISESGSEEPTSPILREGYLIKQGQKIKSWRRRWFTLSRSVLIYRDEEDTSEKGRICLSDVSLVKRSDRYPDKKFLFEIITKSRTYYVTASSEDELNSWTEAISNIIVSSNNSNYDAASLGSS